MASYNRVILMGNLTRDPEVRYLPSGTAVCEMGLAMNESYKNREGQQVDQTCFVDVVVWSRQAETCGQYLSKGSPVLVEGRLQLDSWKNKEGESRSKLRVRADRVQFLSSPRNAQYGDGAAPGQAAEPAPGQAPAYSQPPPAAPPPMAPPPAPAMAPAPAPAPAAAPDAPMYDPPPDVMGGGQDEDNLPF